MGVLLNGFNLAVMPVCVLFMRALGTDSATAASVQILGLAAFSFMGNIIHEYGRKYGKAKTSIKIRKDFDTLSVKMGMAVMMLFVCLCLMFTYTRDDISQLIVLVFADVCCIVIFLYFDIDKAVFVFNKKKSG